MTTDIEKRKPNPVAMIKSYLLDNDKMKARLAEMLGKRGPAFANSIVNVVRNSRQLQKCSPESIGSAALIAATLNLPVDPVLGQAAIVPYGDQACFQLMYRGIIQLCIRSGQYATIHCSEIYEDELKSHNPISGEVKFNDPSTYKMREEKNTDKVVGHYAYFRLVSGFEKSEYMTSKEVIAHAKKYSKAYQYDLRAKKQDSAWSTDPIAMGNKTVLIKLLKRYGIMSLEMQDALVADRETFDEAQERVAKRIESEQGSEPIDAEFDPGEDDPETKAKAEEEKKKLAAAEAKDKKGKRGRPKKDKDVEPKYHCPNCGRKFDTPKQTDEKKGIQCECLHWIEQDRPGFMQDEEAA